MRTNFFVLSEGDNPLDFIGDCAAFVFITNLIFLLTVPEAFLIGQLQPPLGLERRLERFYSVWLIGACKGRLTRHIAAGSNCETLRSCIFVFPHPGGRVFTAPVDTT